jgi:hypothetical protein
MRNNLQILYNLWIVNPEQEDLRNPDSYDDF